MSVMSDNWIKKQCIPPTHKFLNVSQPRYGWADLTESKEYLDAAVARYAAVVLTPEQAEAYGWKPMISPFAAEQVRQADDGQRIASYGVSSYGYDIRAAPEFKLFTGHHHMASDQVIDYKNITDDMFDFVAGDEIIIPPNGFVLTRSIEYVRIPKDVLALCIGKSTIARVGINCLCTPLEPGWEGYITLEFSNSTSRPNKLYANEGVLQLIFLKGDQPCGITYADRNGKYNNQTAEIILPRV